LNNLGKIKDAEGRDSNLFYTILFQPTKTFNYIIENKLYSTTTVLLVLGGIVRSIDNAIEENVGDENSLVFILLSRVFLGALLGWIGYYIYAAVLSFTGEWLGGKANGEKFRTAIGWALIPSIAGLLLLIPGVLIFGKDIFSSSLSNDTLVYETFYYNFMAIYFLLQIWSLIIFIKGVKVIQGFGTFKAIANVLLPILAIIVLVLFLIGLVQLSIFLS